MARTRGAEASSTGMMPRIPSSRQMLEDRVVSIVADALGVMSSEKKRDRAVGRIMAILEDNSDNSKEE